MKSKSYYILKQQKQKHIVNWRNKIKWKCKKLNWVDIVAGFYYCGTQGLVVKSQWLACIRTKKT